MCIPKNEISTSITGSVLPAGMFSIMESTDNLEKDPTIMSRAFRNLKISISSHLKHDAHRDAVSQDETENIKIQKESARNNAIALNICG